MNPLYQTLTFLGYLKLRQIGLHRVSQVQIVLQNLEDIKNELCGFNKKGNT